MRQIPAVLRVADRGADRRPGRLRGRRADGGRARRELHGRRAAHAVGVHPAAARRRQRRVETLRNSLAEAPSRGPAAAAAVAYAAALVAAGDPDAALDVCRDSEDLVVTFVDRYRLDLAGGFAITGGATPTRPATLSMPRPPSSTRRTRPSTSSSYGWPGPRSTARRQATGPRRSSTSARSAGSACSRSWPAPPAEPAEPGPVRRGYSPMVAAGSGSPPPTPRWKRNRK